MFESFKRRSTQAELMDDQAIGYDAFRDCLRDLETVNKLTLAYRPTRRWLRGIFKNADPAAAYSILDVGSGGGDSLRFIARWLARRNRPVRLTGVDLNPWSRHYARQATPPAAGIEFETADIFAFDPGRRVDFVISSLFTHHLDDRQLVRFLEWMETHAARGWFINDLHRHPLAFFSFKYLSRLFGFHYMVRHDGPVSVARAFSRQEWLDALAAARIPFDSVEIRWCFPFRYCLTRRKP